MEPSANEDAQAPSSRSRSDHAKKKRRGHRRNASEYLPDSAHYRAGYSYQNHQSESNRFQDMAPRNNQSSSGSQGPQPSSSTGSGLPRYVNYNSVVNLVTPLHSRLNCRYSSNPALEQGAATSGGTEYERPPPYYYPGASAPTSSDVPPPLPAPNARP